MKIERQFELAEGLYRPAYRASIRGPHWCPYRPGQAPGHPGMHFGASIAWSTRSGSNSSSTAGTTLAVTVTVNAGDIVIVVCATAGNVAIQAPTDNATGGGNKYTNLTNRITNTDSVQVWACFNAKSATTVTMHNTSARHSCAVGCYTGATSFLGATSSNTGSTSPATVSTTQLATDSWIIAGMATHGTGTYSSSTGNLRVSVAGAGSTTPGAALVDNTGSAGSSITTAAGLSAGAAWSAAAINLSTFSPVTGGPWSGGLNFDRPDSFFDVVGS